MDQTTIPNVEKLLEIAKSKNNEITWDEMTNFFGQDYINSPDMENTLEFLESQGVTVIETDIITDDEPILTTTL